MSERITVERKEFEGFLADNQVLLDRYQKLTGRVDELEAENRKLNSQLEESSARLASAEVSVTANLRQTGEALKKARENMARLNREVDKRIPS